MYANRFVPAALFLALAFSTHAHASGIEIIKLDSVKLPTGGYKSVKTTVRASPQLMDEIVRSHVNARRKLIEAEVKKAVSKSDMIANGITLMDVTFFLGQPSVRFTSANAFEVNITGNHFYARSTTPTALGRWADPTFQVNFNLRLVGQLSVPSSTNPGFYVQRATLSVPYAKVTPRNVTGGVVTTFTTIANYFHTAATGQDLLRRAANQHLQSDMTSFCNTMLGNVNGPIKTLREQGYSNVETRFDATRNMLVVEMSKANTLARRPVGRPAKDAAQTRNTGPIQAAPLQAPVPLPMQKPVGQPLQLSPLR